MFSLLFNRTTLPPETLTWDRLETHSTFANQSQNRRSALIHLCTGLIAHSGLLGQ